MNSGICPTLCLFVPPVLQKYLKVAPDRHHLYQDHQQDVVTNKMLEAMPSLTSFSSVQAWVFFPEAEGNVKQISSTSQAGRYHQYQQQSCNYSHCIISQMSQEKSKVSVFQNVASFPRVKCCNNSERALLFSANDYRLLRKGLSVLENTVFASVLLCEWFMLSVHHQVQSSVLLVTV